jgi:hypothetical protein
MTWFDLLFILVFLFTVGSLGRIVYLLARKRSKHAARPAKVLAVALIIYFGTLCAVSLATPRKFIPMGEDRCFDDWCIAADRLTVSQTIGNASEMTASKGVFYIVTIRVSSRALGITQRARYAAVVAIDQLGRTYLPSAEGQRAYDAVNGKAPAITGELGPGASFTTTQVFDIPGDSGRVWLKVEHGVWPGRLIIGDSNSFFHKSTLMTLSS